MGTRRPTLLLVLLLLAGLVPWVPGAVAGTLGSETFEVCLAGSVPGNGCDTPHWYTHTGTGTGAEFNIVSDEALGSKSYRINETSAAGTATGTFNYVSAIGDICPITAATSTFIASYAFFIEVMPSTSGPVISINEGGGVEFQVGISTGGLVSAIIQITGEGPSATLGTVALKTWHNITIDQFVCNDSSAAQVSARFSLDGNAGTVTTSGTDVTTAASGAIEVGKDGGAQLYALNLDNLLITGPGVADGPSIPAGAGLNVNGNIVGFDVDDTGNTIIIRESDTESNHGNVTVISAVTMTNTSNPQSTECSQVDGVMAEPSTVAFLWCSSGNPGNLAIRGTSLQPPAYLNTCSFCTSNISLSLFDDSGGDGSLELGEISSFPLTHTRVGVTSDRQVAWAFSGRDCAYPCGGTNPGVVGFNAYSVDEGGAIGLTRDVAYGGANKGAEDICVGIVDSDRFRIVAVHESATSNRYLADSDTGTLVLEGSYSGFQQARGVSCTNTGDSKVMLGLERGASLDEAWLVNASTGIGYWPGLTGLDIPARGVAVSGDGKWFAVVDGTKVHVGNATTGNITGTATMPTLGSFVGLELDKFGQAMWVATTKNVTRYALTSFTTISPCCFQETPGDGQDGGGDGITGPGGIIDPEVVGCSLGACSTFAGGLFLSALMVLGMAVGTGTVAWQTAKSGTAAGWGIGIGAIVGFLISWAFDWLSVGAVFVVVLLIAAAIYFRVRGRASGG